MITTENLVILFTDIVGFTESTALQSREQNERILNRHNTILLPIVRRFRGRHVKSIGDALLLAFTSPTDAMRCAMAMQDALHEYNQIAPSGEDIHIRVAASLGEVRVTKNDIFGEPVNVTSRIEGITPADEVYFSEAVYLAMNKAEVPAVEIGLQELKGISKPVRIFSIPRFSESRLVPDPAQGVPNRQTSYPFGGMHLKAKPVASSVMERWFNRGAAALSPAMAGAKLLGPNRFTAGLAAVLAGAAVVLLAFNLFTGGDGRRAIVASGVQAGATPDDRAAWSSSSLGQIGNTAIIGSLSSASSYDSVAALRGYSSSSEFSAPIPQIPQPGTAGSSSAGPLVFPTEPPEQFAAASSVPIDRYDDQGAKPTPPAKVAAQPTKAPAITTIIQAKYAYKARRIDKYQYKQIVQRIESEYEDKVRQAKLDYRAGKLTKEGYRNRIIALKIRYIGQS